MYINEIYNRCLCAYQFAFHNLSIQSIFSCMHVCTYVFIRSPPPQSTSEAVCNEFGMHIQEQMHFGGAAALQTAVHYLCKCPFANYLFEHGPFLAKDISTFAGNLVLTAKCYRQELQLLQRSTRPCAQR